MSTFPKIDDLRQGGKTLWKMVYDYYYYYHQHYYYYHQDYYYYHYSY